MKAALEPATNVPSGKVSKTLHTRTKSCASDPNTNYKSACDKTKTTFSGNLQDQHDEAKQFRMQISNTNIEYSKSTMSRVMGN